MRWLLNMQVHLIFTIKQVMEDLPFIKIYCFKNTYSTGSKMFLYWFEFLLIYYKILGGYAKNWIFHQNNIFLYYFSKLWEGYLTMWCVK
jgi:hypothetical protein